MFKQVDNKLIAKVTLKSFTACIAKINEISVIAEELNHHPNLCITNYKDLKIEIFTHDKNTLTAKDKVLANRIEKLF